MNMNVWAGTGETAKLISWLNVDEQNTSGNESVCCLLLSD